MRSFYSSALLLLVFAIFSLPSQAQQAIASPSTNDADKTSPQPAPQEMPETVHTTGSQDKKAAGGDPFGVAPLPKTTTSLVGGRVTKIDGVHSKLGVKVFGGGGQWDIAFDERTRFFRDGNETTFANVKKGDRVYVDTQLDNHRIFARNVRVVTKTGPADARGQVTSFNNGVMTVRDDLSTQPVEIRVTGNTQIRRGDSPASPAELKPGSLVKVRFSPDKEHHGDAQTITVLAASGETFTFVGKVTYLDLSTGVLAVDNRSDDRTYDLSLDKDTKLPSNLTIGSDVTVAAVFDGRQYKASSINVETAHR